MMDDWVLAVLLAFGAGCIVGVSIVSIKSDKVQYQTNLAKFEVMYEKCMGHKKGTVSECKKLAEFKSKTCVTGCE
jgi:hypothetical protein